jgi:hypothetical protein
MCRVKKPNKGELAFRKLPLKGSNELIKYIKRDDTNKSQIFNNHKKSPQWMFTANLLLHSMNNADEEWTRKKR